MDEWYYTGPTGQQGPVSYQQLTLWAQAGQFGPQIMVWRNGMPQWSPAGSVPELAALFGGQGMAPASAYAMPLGYAQPVGPFGYPGQYPTMRYAGFWWRFLAYFIDAVILAIPNNLIQLAVAAAMDISAIRVKPFSPEWFSLTLTSGVVTLVVDWLYFALQESSSKQATLGKRICGLVVTDAQGQRIGFGQACGRYFGKIVSALILYIGFMMAGWTEKKQALHDQLAKTLVWKKP